MKQRPLILVLGLALAMMSGCDDGTTPPTDSGPATTDAGGGGTDSGPGSPDSGGGAAAARCAADCALLTGCGLVGITAAQCEMACGSDLGDCSDTELTAVETCATDNLGTCDVAWFACVGAVACVNTPPPAPPTPAEHCPGSCAGLDGCTYLGMIPTADCEMACATDLADCTPVQMVAAAACDATNLTVGSCSTDWFTCVAAVGCVDDPPPMP